MSCHGCGVYSQEYKPLRQTDLSRFLVYMYENCKDMV